MNIDEVDKVIKDLYDSLKTDNKIIWNQWKIASLSLICSVIVSHSWRIMYRISWLNKKQKKQQ